MCACALVVVFGGAVGGWRETSVGADQAPNPAAVLDAAASYLETYERAVTAVIAQEDYEQRIIFQAAHRRLKSDLLIIADQENGWVEFRDVFEVDGVAVRDRTDRVMKLFTAPNPNAMAQARRVAYEGARFNLNPRNLKFNRTLNVPMTALRYLRRSNQARSEFRLDRMDTAGGTPLAIVKFHEETKPRLIASDGSVPARGSFTIEPRSGRIVHSELEIVDLRVAAKIVVDYVEQPEMALWLPAVMIESYNMPNENVAIDGKATYGNFRQFKVETSTIVK